MPPPLALTVGEPAGIGADIALAAWQRRDELALPAFYLIADPQFVAPGQNGFELRPGSPAFKLGFKPISLAGVGPR